MGCSLQNWDLRIFTAQKHVCELSELNTLKPKKRQYFKTSLKRERCQGYPGESSIFINYDYNPVQALQFGYIRL